MYKRGIVSKVDADTHRVRVTFPGKGDVESPWLDVAVRDAHDDDDFGLPSEGAQVACLMGENDEEGCVIGAIHSKADPPSTPANTDVRRMKMKDGAILEYDRAAHTLKIDVPSGGKLSITVGGDVEIHPTGLVKIDGADDFPALAQKVEDALSTMRSVYNALSVPTGVGPSGPPIVPMTANAPVKCSKLKT